MTTHEALPIPWTELRRAFRCDGWLRDIYIGDTDLSEWQRAYDYVLKLIAHGSARASTHPDHLPVDVADVFPLQDTVGARMDLAVGNVGINCHFFSEEWIEFDINPCGVPSPAEARTILDFMEGLAIAVGRGVMLTGDSQPWDLWLTFDPTARTWAKGDMFKKRDDELEPVLRSDIARR